MVRCIGWTLTVSSAPCSDTVWRNRRARFRGCLFGLTGFLLPLFLFASILFGAISRDFWLSLLGMSGVETLEIYLVRTILSDHSAPCSIAVCMTGFLSPSTVSAAHPVVDGPGGLRALHLRGAAAPHPALPVLGPEMFQVPDARGPPGATANTCP